MSDVEQVTIEGRVVDFEGMPANAKVTIRRHSDQQVGFWGGDLAVGSIIRRYPEQDDVPVALTPGPWDFTIERLGGPQAFDPVTFTYTVVAGQSLTWQQLGQYGSDGDIDLPANTVAELRAMLLDALARIAVLEHPFVDPAEDVNDPGFFVPGDMAELPGDPGFYDGNGLHEDPSDPGFYLIGAAA